MELSLELDSVIRVASMIALAVSLCGCGSDDTASPATLGAGTLAGYGRANAWADDIDATCADLEAMADAGDDLYTIELGGARDFANVGQAEWIGIVGQAYPRLMLKARELGITVLVSIANDNSGSGKYGQDGPKLANMTAFSMQLVSLVDSVGPENVILQPVAETQTSGGRWLEEYAVERLLPSGFVMAYNGDKGSPSSKPSWATWRVWHPFDIFEVPQGDMSDCIVVSDTGRIVRKLGGGTLDGAGDPVALKAWARNMRDAGAVAAIYYVFRYAGPIDKPSMHAMAEGVK